MSSRKIPPLPAGSVPQRRCSALLARNLAVDLAPHRINVNNIAPGAIATPINQAVLDDPEAKHNAISDIPWGRFGLPKEVAAFSWRATRRSMLRIVLQDVQKQERTERIRSGVLKKLDENPELRRR